MGVAEPRHLGDLFLDAAGIFRPPERLTVTEAAKKYRYLKNRPKYEGPYKPDETPYMIEPQNMTMSPDFQSVIFCGPSQSGKTEALILNSLAFVVKCNPMDYAVFCATAVAARDFAKRRIDRMHRHSEKLKEELLPG